MCYSVARLHNKDFLPDSFETPEVFPLMYETHRTERS